MKLHLALFFSFCLACSGCSTISSKTYSNSDEQISTSEHKSNKPSKGADSMFTELSTAAFLLGLAALVLAYGNDKDSNN